MIAVTLKKQYYANDNLLKRLIMAIKRTNADIWFSKAVRLRDGHCLVCGTDQTLECAHIYGRRRKIVRYSMDNAVTLCHHHHRVFTENPLAFAGFLETELGAGHLEILTEKCRGILKENKAVRDEIAKHYREQYDQLRALRECGVTGYIPFEDYY